MRSRVMVIASVILAASIIILLFSLRPHTTVPTFTFVNVDSQQVLKSQDISLVLSKTLDSIPFKYYSQKSLIGKVDNGANLYRFEKDGKNYILYELVSSQKPFFGKGSNMEQKIYEYSN